jgi:hypothetical protein
MRGTIRRTLLPVSLVVIASAALCDRSQTGRSDGIPLTANSYLPVDYRLTSELYRKWLAAQENLNRDVGGSDRVLSTSRISVTQPTPERIDALVGGLERNERTRRAIESAGLSVRDYVLTTIALYQALQPPRRTTVAQLNPDNVQFVSHNRDEILRIRNASQFQIADCDEDFDHDGDADAGYSDYDDADGDDEDFVQADEAEDFDGDGDEEEFDEDEDTDEDTDD